MQMIYKNQIKIPSIHFCNDDFRNQLNAIQKYHDVVVVTDPPFNIGYHYNQYVDRMENENYYKMLAELLDMFPCVFIHYPEALHELSIRHNAAPKKIVSWVYNSNTARQHRDVAWYGIEPVFTNALQPYKNPDDKRIKERISRGIRGGGECMIGGMLTR